MARRVGQFVLVLVFMAANASPASATNNTFVKWADYPYQSWQHYIRYRLQTGWPGGDNGTQALMVSHGRWQWNELNRELHFSWAPMGQTNRRIDVSYEDLAPPYTSYWAVTMVENWTWDAKMADVNIAFNSQPDGYPAHTFWWWSSSTSVPQNRVDAISITVHEFGHAVSLLHTKTLPDVMFETINAGVVRRALSTHDIQSFNSMYPPK